ncbi:MAG: helix-turn-helix transcriptional regulator [Paracoccaceae bacterium]
MLENRLRELRIQAGLTQAELAAKVGVSRQTIIALESGRYEPSLRLGMLIAQQYDCTVEDVFRLSVEK